MKKKTEGYSVIFIIYWIPDLNNLTQPGIFLPDAISHVQFPMQKKYIHCVHKKASQKFFAITITMMCLFKFSLFLHCYLFCF